jgi:hypothetical protein
VKRVPADVPGRSGAGPGVAGDAAGRILPLFTAPSFRTFTGLACGFLAQSGKRTVCGMLTGAGLSRSWPRDRAHSFFARARWNPDDLGIAVAKLVMWRYISRAGPSPCTPTAPPPPAAPTAPNLPQSQPARPRR